MSRKRLCTFLSSITVGVLPSGKASGFDPDIRWFESIYPCHKEILVIEYIAHITYKQDGDTKVHRFWQTDDEAAIELCERNKLGLRIILMRGDKTIQIIE